jgi:flagellar basal-body rod protein FlgG
MLEGMYSAAAGMAAQQAQMDAISNDLANVNTHGYKKERVAFRDLLYTPEDLAVDSSVSEGAGAVATSIGRGSAQGSFQRTDEPLDVGLSGPGFLTVKMSDGSTALTRDGNLKLDDKGRLGDHLGRLVEPPITVPAGTDPKDITIATDGTVDLDGKSLGKLRIVSVPSVDGLRALGDNLFAVTKDSGPLSAAPKGTGVAQGVLEASNVDMGDSMSDMIIAQRSYEMASRAIQMQDKAAEIANGVKR